MEVDVNTTLAGMPAVVTPPDLELIDEVLDMSELDGKTTKKYKQHLLEFRAYLDEKAAGKPLSAVEKNDVKRFLADLMHGKRYGMTGDGKPRQGELSPSTRKSVVSALRALYVHCIDLYGLPLDPCYRITVKQPKPKRGLTISEADVKRILDAPGRERDRVQAHLKFYTAARTISLRNLLWSDVDFERNVIHFDAKFNDAYTVHMHPQLKAALLRWRDAVEKQAERRQAVRVALTDPDTAFVLLTCNGLPLCHTSIAKQCKLRAARVGVLLHHDPSKVGKENWSRIHPHAFRRTAATLLREKGADLADVADLLHHKDINTTRDHYAFTSTARKKKTVMGLTL
jgi:integrase